MKRSEYLEKKRRRITKKQSQIIRRRVREGEHFKAIADDLGLVPTQVTAVIAHMTMGH